MRLLVFLFFFLFVNMKLLVEFIILFHLTRFYEDKSLKEIMSSGAATVLNIDRILMIYRDYWLLYIEWCHVIFAKCISDEAIGRSFLISFLICYQIVFWNELPPNCESDVPEKSQHHHGRLISMVNFLS